MKKLRLNSLNLSDSDRLTGKEKKEIAGGLLGGNDIPFCGALCPYDPSERIVCIRYSCVRCSEISQEYAHLCQDRPIVW